MARPQIERAWAAEIREFDLHGTADAALSGAGEQRHTRRAADRGHAVGGATGSQLSRRGRAALKDFDVLGLNFERSFPFRGYDLLCPERGNESCIQTGI
jgi:hypothetical protein